MNLTNDDVQEILRLLDASSFDELQLSTDRFKLTLRRGGSGGWTQETTTARGAQKVKPASAGRAAANAPSALDAPSAPAPPGSTTRAASDAAPSTAELVRKAASADGLIDIFPPIIGTFYRAPKPGAAPFVEVGSKVEKDTVIGIVETMKLMNSVYAGTAGIIVEICATNGHLVEQDHVLMRLRAP